MVEAMVEAYEKMEKSWDKNVCDTCTVQLIYSYLEGIRKEEKDYSMFKAILEARLIKARSRVDREAMILPLLSFFISIFAMLTSMSGIKDDRNILIILLFGTLVAALTTIYIVKRYIFQYPKKQVFLELFMNCMDKLENGK